MKVEFWITRTLWRSINRGFYRECVYGDKRVVQSLFGGHQGPQIAGTEPGGVCGRNSWEILKTHCAPDVDIHSVTASHGRCLSRTVIRSRLYLESVSMMSVRTGSQGGQKVEEWRDEPFHYGQAGGVKERRSPPKHNPGHFLPHWVGKQKRKGPNQLLILDHWVTNSPSSNLGCCRGGGAEETLSGSHLHGNTWGILS